MDDIPSKLPPSSAGLGEADSSVVDSSLAIAHTVLDGLKSIGKIASAAGVPYVGPAAEVALRLVELAEQCRRNKADCDAVIRDACHVVYFAHLDCQEKCEKYEAEKRMYQSQGGKGPIDANMREKLHSLLRTMRNIEGRCKKFSQQHPLKRFFMGGNIAIAIGELRSELDWAMKMFGFRTSMQIQNTLEQIAQKLAENQVQPVQYSTTNQLNVKAHTILNIEAKDCWNEHTNYYNINYVPQTPPNASQRTNEYFEGAPTDSDIPFSSPQAGLVESS
ncbi:hypothetical protein GALMADRAFT_145684 [Galerina marginata CBS 339.88]|uniref:Uncharacterized protein n=1 Tax=Galerina marginata (strain CBS 339.88) TaxID=685588 RepID=A0A067SH04_GALM3|nr:hypothetical protein GALMADRAFT_145684 [Galerina marginata CBS 339.88]